MLVTKHEVKSASKKLLSVFLAVIMIMTSMSVCFGSFTMASAANIGSDFSGYTTDAIEYLAEHLNGDTVKKYTDKISIGNTKNDGKANSTNNVTYVTDIKVDTYEEYCELRDILIYIDKAVKGTECYQVGTADTNDEETKSCVSAGDVEAEILDGIGGYSTPSDAAKEFLAYVLEDERAVQHSKASTSDKSPAKHTATLNVYTEDYKGYLEAHDGGNYSTVDASIEMGFTYSMYMKGGLYYSVKTTCGSDTYKHNMIWPSAYPINAPSSISNKANTSVKTTLATYASYVDNFVATNTFDAMAVKSTEAIEALKTEIANKTTEIKNYIADAGEGKQDQIYDKLFPGYAAKISTFNKNADDAKAIALYSGLANDIAAYQAANPNYGVFNWGGFDEATIKADYKSFTETYASLLNNATVYNFFVKQKVFSGDYINNFRDNTIAYDLEDLKEEKLMPLYDKYALSFPMEGGNELSLAEKQSAYSELSGYINNVRSYTTQVQNVIFPESLNQYLDLQEKLECQVAECVVYFAEHVGQDYTDVSTDDVIAEIGTAKAQLAALNNLKNSIDYADNTALLDGAFANANTFIAYLYSLLGERYTAQVEIVDATYTAIGRPTSNLTIKQYSQLNAYVNGIEQNIVEFLDAEGKGSLVSTATRNKYAAIDRELMPAFNAFEIDRGFNNYSAEDVLIRREDNSEEIFRENSDKDNDGIGEYEVTDDNVNEIIDILEAALKDPAIAQLLGNLINKDENGNPTGEAFSLSGLITNLLNESVFTDSLINTVVQFVYPLVLKEFAKVWAGIEPTLTITVPDVIGSLDANVKCGLGLDDVETAIASVGLYIAPTTLAANLRSKFPQYSDVASVLETITQKAKYDKVTDTFRNPWENVGLFEDVIDETTGQPVLNDDGTVKRAYKLNWGVDEATDKRAAFLDAATAALSGLEPLLMAIISNKSFANANESDGAPRGVRVGYGGGTASVTLGITVTVKVTIEPITLVLMFDKNDGWDNALAPIFEAMGLTNIPHSEDLQTTRKLLENGLLAMIDQLIEKLDANPVEFILDALPNLCYALEGGLIEPLLHQLKTGINYYADAYYDAQVTSNTLKYAMGTCIKDGDNVVGWDPILINIGEMINLEEMGLDISNFNAIWNMIAGGVELLANAEAPDAAYIASLGKLVEKNTNRSVKTYTAGTAGKAYHINANRADVLQYLVKWLLESGLLEGIVKEPTEFVTKLFANLKNNSNDAVAAIVELLTQETIYNAKNFNWFDGTIDGVSVLGNSATEIYLNPNNDWTEAKAEYLYNNIDALLATIFNLAGLDLDKETAELDTDLGAFIGGAIGGLLSDKTLTALAGALAGLDLNALLAGEAEETTPDASEPETVAEGEESGEDEATEAPALDITALINDLLGIDLSVFAAEGGMYKTIAADLEADENYEYDFGVDAAEDKAAAFAAALTTVLAPLDKVLNFILAGDNLEIKLGTEKVILHGADGYNNGLIPLLEALGCDVTARADLGETSELAAVINALVARINALTTGDVVKNIINLLPGVLYFITSNGLSTSVLNLLQPVVVIIDTIRPVINVMDLINNIEVGEEGAKKPLKEFLGGEINLERLDVNFIFKLLPMLLPDLDLSGLKNVIYDVCDDLGVTYTSKSTLQSTWKKGAYNDNFKAHDMLTVVLSFVLEWATVADNAAKLDKLLKTDGIIASLNTVFASVEITYGTPNWMYWFEDEAAFDAYLAGDKDLPNTLYALEYPNDWTEAKAQYIAGELPALVDMIIGLVNKDKEDAPATLKALLNKLIADNINAETLNSLVGMIAGLLGDIDENLLELAGYILGDSSTDKKEIDIVGLKNYRCDKEITTLSGFINELADVLDTYASGLVNWLFFGDDFRFAKKSDNTDTIVINGGLGYEKGLALILEALGCELPTEVNTKSVLGALATRVDAILANPVDEVLGLLPNLIYALNANALGVAVNNLLQPVNALLDKLSAFGLEISIADLIKFELNGEEITLNLANLSLTNVVEILKKALPGFNFAVVEDYLVNFCTGKIEKGTYIYKMTAPKEDVVTIILTIALLFVKDETNAAKLDEMLNINIISTLDEVFKSTPVEYLYPDYNYFNGEIDVDKGTIEVIENAITYPNDWTEEKAKYLADNLPALVDTIIKMIAINGVKYDSLEELLNTLLAEANVFSAKTLNDLIALITKLLANVDDKLLKYGALLNVDLVGLKAYTAPETVDTVEEFADELANILNTYVKGIVEWLLLGDDIKLGVSDVDAKGTKLEGEDIITINGAYGYAEGLALILEALGCEDLPTATGETEDIVSGVLTSLANRINDILSNDVDEDGKVTKTIVDKILELLPNLIYFLNANGVATSVNNLAGAFNALALKLKSFGLNITLDDLVNLKTLMKLEGTDAKISLQNLTIADILEAVSLMTGLDLTVLKDVLTGFALGEVKAYESVSSLGYTAKMEFTEAKDKHDMITVLVTAVLLVLNVDGNAAKIDAMAKTDLVSKILTVIEGAEIVYVTPDWNYMDGIETDKGIEGYVNAIVAYPNDWTEEKAQYLATNLPTLVDTVIKMVEINGVKYDSLADLLQANVNVFTADTLNSLVGLITGLLKDIDDGLLEAAGVLLGADVVGLKSYKAPETVDTVEEFAIELANVLNKYAKGVVEWLLLGKDYKFFVKDVAENEEGKKLPVDAIVINGAQGYAEGLALLLEALGCENLPKLDGSETTEEIVKAVLTSLAARIDEILANPVEEVLDLLPNLIYFLDADGVDAVITNTTAALTALVGKLSTFGISLDINSLVNLPALMGIEDKYAEGDDVIALNNLTLRALLKALSLMTGLDFTELQNVLVPFALGEATKYDSVSSKDAYKMVYKTDLDKHDMITVVVTAALRMFVENEDNAAKLDEMLGTEIISALKDVFADVEITYEAPDWKYPLAANGTVDAMMYSITYPTNWTKDTAIYVTENLVEIVDLVANLIDSNYDSLSALLTAKVNVFTSENLQTIVDLIANLLEGIDDGLLDAAGVLLGADVTGLKKYTVPAGITTVDAFAAELAKVLNTYAKGLVEWFLLGNDYRFFVKEVKDGAPVDFIVINGANGYAEGLALLLEALGCENLPAADGKTEDIVAGVLASLAARINEIFANPVAEVLDLLPNLIYFLNTNGVAAVVENTLAAITVLLDKLAVFGIDVDIKELVDLKSLMGLEKTNAAISLDNLSMAALLEAVGLMTKLNLTKLSDVLVGFAMGQVDEYESVSANPAYKMTYKKDFEKYDMVTVLANLVLLALAEEGNREVIEGLVGEKAYTLIMNLYNLDEVAVQEFSWQLTEKADTDYVFSALDSSVLYKEFEYGPNFTEEMAEYIAANAGDFIDNIIYLLGLQINGNSVDSLEELLNSLVNGSLYNSKNVIAIRDALAGILANLSNLKLNGKLVGNHIEAVLKTAGIADITAVAKVQIPEFEEDRAKFEEYLCDVVEPLAPVLRWLLADQDIKFFVKEANNADGLVALKGAGGYAFGIIPLLETLECEGIMAPADYYAAVEANPDVFLTAILDPLFNRLDVIFADPATEVLDMLPNLIYFINSNGLDTVVKNTLNAVYTLLKDIEPLVVLDIYELFGIDLAEIDFNWLLEKVVELIKDSTGYELAVTDFNALAELTTGKLVSYKSLNGKTAYKMVYAKDSEGVELKADTVTVLMRSVITFVLTENNREVIVNILKDTLGMSADAEKYVTVLLDGFADVVVGKKGEDLRLGMDTVLATIYYVFYGLDTGVDNVVAGKKDLDKLWSEKIKELGYTEEEGKDSVGNLITDIFDILFNDPDEEGNFPVGDGNDVADKEEIAPNGFIAFFQRIAKFFEEIGEFFRNLFSFGK